MFFCHPNRSNYVGQKILENSFDPSGRGRTMVLDDLVIILSATPLKDILHDEPHWYLQYMYCYRFRSPQHPNRLQREAMILSCFAGIIMVSNKKTLSLVLIFSFEPQGSIVCPLTLSYHPFAMLRSYKAVQHAKRHSKSECYNSFYFMY
uniref:Uncharacterized protein n=1 Tax=Xiphophorus maculatus TaxID=8083 RepID=A0A3B5PUJ9_XIPMA